MASRHRAIDRGPYTAHATPRWVNSARWVGRLGRPDMLESARAGRCSSASSKLNRCCWRRVEQNRVSSIASSQLVWAGVACGRSKRLRFFCARSLRRVCFLVGRSTSWSGSRRRLPAFWLSVYLNAGGGRRCMSIARSVRRLIVFRESRISIAIS